MAFQRGIALVGGLLASAAAQRIPTSCFVNSTKGQCPIVGQLCDQTELCAKGMYCQAKTVGQNGASFSGTCATAPTIAQIYAKPCTLGNDVPNCVYNNPLALSPLSPPSALRCVRAFATDTAGTCRIGPNKHGDACNLNAECASGQCLSELGQCNGVAEGQSCTPSYPDPCQPAHYCQATAGGASTSGVCAKVVSAGNACPAAEGCDRGLYCAGADVYTRKCIAPFTVPDYTNVTVGPFMCASANAVLVQAQTNVGDSLYQCRPINNTASMVGAACDPTFPAPMGYECVCSGAATQYRLRTLGGLGIGARSAVWAQLFQCLVTATGVMGASCEFDSTDLSGVRYGSCAYYACYPYYLALVNATGSRDFNAPFLQFQNFAPCEMSAATAYYAGVMSTPCVTLPNLENWRCASLAALGSLSVANTGGVIAFVFLVVLFMYVGHMYAYRHHNKTHIPCIKD